MPYLSDKFFDGLPQEQVKKALFSLQRMAGDPAHANQVVEVREARPPEVKAEEAGGRVDSKFPLDYFYIQIFADGKMRVLLERSSYMEFSELERVVGLFVRRYSVPTQASSYSSIYDLSEQASELVISNRFKLGLYLARMTVLLDPVYGSKQCSLIVAENDDLVGHLIFMDLTSKLDFNAYLDELKRVAIPVRLDEELGVDVLIAPKDYEGKLSAKIFVKGSSFSLLDTVQFPFPVDEYLRRLFLLNCDMSYEYCSVPFSVDECVLRPLHSGASFVSEKSLVDALRKTAKGHPDSIALKDSKVNIHYNQLLDLVVPLAKMILDFAPEKEFPIGISMSKSCDYDVARLAILFSGRAFISLKRNDRANLEKCKSLGVSLVLADHDDRTRFPADCRLKRLTMKAGAVEAELDEIEADSTAHIVLSSGTTGKPVAFAVPHEGLCSVLTNLGQALNLNESSVIFDPFNVVFDMSVMNLSALIYGAAVYVGSDNSISDMKSLSQELLSSKATHIIMVGSHYSLLFDYAIKEGIKFPEMQYILLGGESIPRDIYASVSSVFTHPDLKLGAGFGTTQTCGVDTTNFKRVSEGDEVDDPFGILFDDKMAAAFDFLGFPVPFGFSGSFALSGPMAKAVQLKSDDSLFGAGAFVKPSKGRLSLVDNDAANLRLKRYAFDLSWMRTSDIAVLSSDRVLSLSRQGSIVKFQGEFVDIGRIQTALESLKQTTSAFVFVSNSCGSEFLAAVCVMVARVELTLDEFKPLATRALLEQSIPVKHYPSLALARPGEIPLTSNGKANHKQLISFFSRERRSETVGGPENEYEAAVQSVLKEMFPSYVVNCSIPLNEQLYQLNNSVKWVEFVQGLNREFDYNFSAVSFLVGQSVRDIADCIDLLMKKSETAPSPISFSAQEIFPLSSEQYVMKSHMDSMADGGVLPYMLRSYFACQGKMASKDSIVSAIRQVVEGHAALRAFYNKQGQHIQVLTPSDDLFNHIVFLLPDAPIDEPVDNFKKNKSFLECQSDHMAHCVSRDYYWPKVGFYVQYYPSAKVYLIYFVCSHMLIDLNSMGVLFENLKTLLSGGKLEVSDPLRCFKDSIDKTRIDPEFVNGDSFRQLQKLWGDLDVPLKVVGDHNAKGEEAEEGYGPLDLDPVIEMMEDGVIRSFSDWAGFFSNPDSDFRDFNQSSMYIAIFAFSIARQFKCRKFVIGVPLDKGSASRDVIEDKIFAVPVVIELQERDFSFKLLAQSVYKQLQTLKEFFAKDGTVEELVALFQRASNYSDTLFDVLLTFVEPPEPFITDDLTMISSPDFSHQATMPLTIYVFPHYFYLQVSKLVDNTVAGSLCVLITEYLSSVNKSTYDDFGFYQDELNKVPVSPALTREQMLELSPFFSRQAMSRYPKLLSGFLTALKMTPDAPCVVTSSQIFTYSEIAILSLKTQYRLRELGVEPGDRVVASLSGTVENILLRLALLNMQATFVPFEAEFSDQEALSALIKDVEAKICLVDQGGLGFDFTDKFHELSVADLLATPMDESITWREIKEEDQADKDFIVYIRMSTGTTGVPKYACIDERALSAFSQSLLKFDISREAVIALAYTRFDIHDMDLLRTIFTGGALHIVSRAVMRDAKQLVGVIRGSRLSSLQATPSWVFSLIEEGLLDCDPMRIYIGGEPIPVRLCRQLLEKGFEVWQCYGPLGATIWGLMSSVTLRSVDDFESAGYAHVPPHGEMDHVVAFLMDVNGKAEVCFFGDGVYKPLTGAKPSDLLFTPEMHRPILSTGDIAEKDGSFFVLRGRDDLRARGFYLKPLDVDKVIIGSGAARASYLKKVGFLIIVLVVLKDGCALKRIHEALLRMFDAMLVSSLSVQSVAGFDKNVSGKVDFYESLGNVTYDHESDELLAEMVEKVKEYFLERKTEHPEYVHYVGLVNGNFAFSSILNSSVLTDVLRLVNQDILGPKRIPLLDVPDVMSQRGGELVTLASLAKKLSTAVPRPVVVSP